MPNRSPPGAYQLYVALRGVRPPIWRRLEVPASLSLLGLHQVLQAAFGWTNTTLFQFHIGDNILDVTEQEVDVQRILPGSPLLRMTARDCAKAAKRGASITYAYDMAEYWEVDILVEREICAREARAFPLCTGGGRCAPPDGCGGMPGFDGLRASARRSAARGEMVPEFDPEEFDQCSVNEALQGIDSGVADEPTRWTRAYA